MNCDCTGIHCRIPTKCGWCGRKMKARSASNDPAYCSYECGVNAQPDKAKASIGTGRGLNAA
jgi:hypothetical protein